MGIDTGGTFTDFVVYDGRRLRVHKVLSTPHAPEQAILQGIADLQLQGCAGLQVVHGSTVATNAVLEGKGARTAYVTNRGLADVLSIGRQTRGELYNLQPAPRDPPVPPQWCLETGGRLGADGSVVEPLSDADLRQLRAAIERIAPQSVAINLLFSFLDERFEQAIEQVMPAGIFVSRSSAVLAEYREYERGMTTWLNAYVGPLVQGYLQRLRTGVPQAGVAVMQSSGGTIDASQAGGQAVHLLLSGPAGGLAGARHVAAAAGRERLLTFDMGGTSTDVALIEGELRLTSEGSIAGYPVGVPMVDMHTIGAGGGSIATVDAGGLLQVGPESAGADPGPACYGRGGRYPTVTDANLVLGRLRADAFLGGAMTLDVAAARTVIGRLAETLAMTLERAAEGIIRVANEHMARALRVISVERGVDPRDYTLVSFGGAGGLHVCALAEALQMRQAMVPVHGGVLSALGMLAAPRTRQLSRTVAGLLPDLDRERLLEHFDALIEQGSQALVAEAVAASEIRVERSLDLRYLGQSYTLNVPWSNLQAAADAFHAAHEQRYGHRLDLPIELVNVRAALRGPQPVLRLAHPAGGSAAPRDTVSIYGVGEPTPIFDRGQMGTGMTLQGPALITETVATTYVAPGWRCEVHDSGNLLLEARAPTRPGAA